MPVIRFYAVAIGAQPGIYLTWEGTGGAQEQVDLWPHARHKAFKTRGEAEAFMQRELFDKLQGMRADSHPAAAADENAQAGPSGQIESLTPNLIARLEAREKYIRSLPPDAGVSGDVVMREESVTKTEG